MAAEHADHGEKQKKSRSIIRQMTTPLFMLRCLQIGLSLRDLDLVTEGMVIDMATERANDEAEWDEMPTQADFDNF